MNKKFIISIALLLSACTLLSSCLAEDEAETTAPVETITEAQIGNNGYDDSPTGRVENVTEAEATTAEESTQAQEEETTLIGTLIGYSSKGYPITEKDGITYVDGILVANKTYSLPEDYNPGELLTECSEAFEKMKSEAAKEDLVLWNASGFRSYELQESLYTRYSDRDGKEAADRYSARPGHSEHQTGLAIDLNTITSAFADTAEGKWVSENCHKYGFILRYPQDKESVTGYMYEAWHIRYVGVDTATKIYESGLCFEEYFGITSQYADTAETLTEAEDISETEAADSVSSQDIETTSAVISEETTIAVIID